MVIQIGKYRSESGDIKEILQSLNAEITCRCKSQKISKESIFKDSPITLNCFYKWLRYDHNPTVKNIVDIFSFFGNN